MKNVLVPVVGAVIGGLVGFYWHFPGVMGFFVGMVWIFVVAEFFLK